MKFSHCTIQDLDKALKMVNKKYKGNIEYNRTPDASKQFTLRVKDSHGKGARLGYKWNDRPQRHLINACWHVHGNFFDALFKVNPEAIIHSGKNKITKDFGNWQDRNIGSVMIPMWFSEACECNK